MSKMNGFEKFSNKIIQWTGSSGAFGIASMLVVGWILCGPIFGFSDTWQLVINTGTTIITFLMVFLIQKPQNKDGKAIHLKLNELIAASPKAKYQLVEIEAHKETGILSQHKN